MSGVMVSLTPVFKASIPRQVALSEYAEFKDPDDMVQKLNDILSRPDGLPRIPETRTDCEILHFNKEKKRHNQYVMCPEQECESLIYHADQSRSRIEVLGLHRDPFWEARVKAFYGWYSKYYWTTRLTQVWNPESNPHN